MDFITISGRVVHGDGYGKKLGFPTVNLDRRSYASRALNIKLGVYSGTAAYKLKTKNYKLYKAAIVIGPIDKTGLPKIEAHLLNFKGNLYGQKIILSLGKYIRPFKKFKSEPELKKQISKDILNVRGRRLP
jgi:riboflavin kinase / FMN adenylyltransferase